MKTIAFGHRRYVGKDTCAGFLVAHLRTNTKGKHVRKMGFASKLKEICHSLYGWAGLKDEDYYEQHPKEKDQLIVALNKTVRDIWIEVGNHLRSVYEDTWLSYLHGLTCDYLVLKDLRYPNEALGVKAKGGYLIRVDNPRIEKHGDIADSALAEWTEWDEVLVNDGDLKSLNQKIMGISKRYFNV